LGTSSLLSGLLPIAIVVLMLGLGLALTPADFGRAVRSPRAVAVCLFCQVLLVPAVCFALVSALGIGAPLAVGMMLLAATPGGTTAGLFSHLAGGDVALNITLTAVNSVLAVVTLPVLVNLSAAHFLRGGLGDLALGPGELASVWAVILIPVALGMLVRARRTALAERMDRPVKILSMAFLAILAAVTAAAERDILEHLRQAGPAAALLCAISLAIGYGLPRLLGVSGPQAIASSMDIGIHNSGLAMAIALSPAMMGNPEFAVPAVAYAVITIPCAGVTALVLSRTGRPRGAHHGDVPNPVLQEDLPLGDEPTPQVERDGRQL
jgi:BASS family bile acid:Na+ symporter